MEEEGADLSCGESRDAQPAQRITHCIRSKARKQPGSPRKTLAWEDRSGRWKSEPQRLSSSEEEAGFGALLGNGFFSHEMERETRGVARVRVCDHVEAGTRLNSTCQTSEGGRPRGEGGIR